VLREREAHPGAGGAGLAGIHRGGITDRMALRRLSVERGADQARLATAGTAGAVLTEIDGAVGEALGARRRVRKVALLTHPAGVIGENIAGHERNAEPLPRRIEARKL